MQCKTGTRTSKSRKCSESLAVLSSVSIISFLPKKYSLHFNLIQLNLSLTVLLTSDGDICLNTGRCLASCQEATLLSTNHNWDAFMFVSKLGSVWDDKKVLWSSQLLWRIRMLYTFRWTCELAWQRYAISKNAGSSNNRFDSIIRTFITRNLL